RVVIMILANFGLSQILYVSVQILGFIYPIALSLIILGLFHQYIGKYTYVFAVSVLVVAIFCAIVIFNKNVMMYQWTSA
ncbi:branched-chain amino acid transport system II carrier protein, partial [Bacillus cereus]|nr:branched-chain amino acid transport system II carrier protein [Bacillus cereus]